MSTPIQSAAATPPASWPDAPVDLTFSTLKDIEACPRRWALSSASYPSLWDDRGYPPKVQLNALAGTVVHAVLEIVTKELVGAGCPSVHDASAVGVLQRLGGLTQIVSKAIDHLASRVGKNPRAAKLVDYFTRSLRAQTPELRGRIQMMLARRVLPSKPSAGRASGVRRERGPIGFGVYCEIELRVPRLGWKGRADLLALASDSCEITDFKTGEPSDDHAFQLRIYALLWNQDEILNPTARLATRLVLAHPQGDTTVVAPTIEEITELETQLATRGAAARKAIAADPPEAMPSPQQCRYCGVRHLCETYWQPEVQQRMADETKGEVRSFVDVEVSIERRHGPKSWDIVFIAGTNQTRGLLRTSGDLDFQSGQKLRILDVAQAAADPESAGIRCLTIGILSEVYVVSSLSH